MEPQLALRQRFESLKGAEQNKNDLIEELLHHVDKLAKDYDRERLDHARETQFNRDIQQKEIQLQNDVRRYKAVMDCDPFILVLIDGDGMIFNDNLIAKGEAGGRKAAEFLWNAVTEYVHRNASNVPHDIKIQARIYANLKGLGDTCKKAGIIDRSELMEDFARGFTGSKQLFDFVDVGMGKDRADDKLSELFKLHFHDYHCRQIIFGCSHDNGYARLLEDITDPAIYDRVTLLEGVPFEKELLQLKSKYQTTRFEDLFRATKISIYQQNNVQPPMVSGLSPGLPSIPLHNQAPLQSDTMARPSSMSSASGNGLNSTAPTWAAATATPAPPYIASPPPTPRTSQDGTQLIPRNRYGQRIDPPVQFDPNEIKRIKKLKLCNVHYLRGDCLFDPCSHDHDYKPNKNELAALRYLSRMIPCRYNDCEDPKCHYGHHCPLSVPGCSDCRWGENCRFDREQHGVDTNIVKTTRVGGK